jgi:hypothetical protein
MTDYDYLEQQLNKKLKVKDARKRPKMKISGRRVLALKKILTQRNKKAKKT